MFVLNVAIYTSLGGQFDKPPHDFAKFKTLAECLEARQHVEEKSGPLRGWTYVAVCEPRP